MAAPIRAQQSPSMQPTGLGHAVEFILVHELIQLTSLALGLLECVKPLVVDGVAALRTTVIYSSNPHWARIAHLRSLEVGRACLYWENLHFLLDYILCDGPHLTGYGCFERRSHGTGLNETSVCLCGQTDKIHRDLWTCPLCDNVKKAMSSEIDVMNVDIVYYADAISTRASLRRFREYARA
ncbi:hypothetical protein EVAR_14896_1 [Eumeta japonica]|uniref:Uncharacterized protein n=1 Tax=Eumeta variegata TaxID=151549 RepID=A0A4C1V4Q2_EUMVA|nr:hypothetical protein EVAR_14896_1 [Eumeta japonica]